MRFFSEDIIIIRDLFSKGKSNIYFYHEKYLLSPGQLARSLKKLIQMDIAKLDDDELKITEYGIKWIISNRKEIFLEKKELFWKEVPEYIKSEQIEINQIYKPEKRLLDYKYFSKILEE